MSSKKSMTPQDDFSDLKERKALYEKLIEEDSKRLEEIGEIQARLRGHRRMLAAVESCIRDLSDPESRKVRQPAARGENARRIFQFIEEQGQPVRMAQIVSATGIKDGSARFAMTTHRNVAFKQVGSSWTIIPGGLEKAGLATQPQAVEGLAE